MAIRMRFDGGKVINRCNRGSWHHRCHGAALRLNEGETWSPLVWTQCTGDEVVKPYQAVYDKRQKKLDRSRQYQRRTNVRQKSRKRKLERQVESTAKKARLSYGPEAESDEPDISVELLEQRKLAYYSEEVVISSAQAKSVEEATTEQSTCQSWHEERRKRVTASNFGSIISRRPNIPVKPLVSRLLYGTFNGNSHTRYGLREESSTKREYVLAKQERGIKVDVRDVGLSIHPDMPWLAGSPDGHVVETNPDQSVDEGLIEIKNVMKDKQLTLQEGVQSKNVKCLHIVNGALKLKTSHEYFFQCHGLMEITGRKWIDFVIRTASPHSLHIERICVDHALWNNKMLPKLKAFYFAALLPELASPRLKRGGIGEPGVWVSIVTT
jgi:hypothetical protein